MNDEAQCVVHADYSPVCFFDLKRSLDGALVRGTWPAFPEVTLGPAESAGAGDYVLQVEILLDALPPDATGPGWSAGAKSRFRLLRDGRVLTEETLSSRSDAEFAYGAPLGQGASRVIDATARHIAERVSAVPETRTPPAADLPLVASRTIVPALRGTPTTTSPIAVEKDPTPAPAPELAKVAGAEEPILAP